VNLDQARDAYLRHVSIERGLSANTVAAYRRDLEAYLVWLGLHSVSAIDDITVANTQTR
jgi:integrase/recombinase XerD